MPTAAELRQFAKAIDSGEVAFWVCDADSRLIFASDATNVITGGDAESVRGLRALAGNATSDDPKLVLASRLAAPPGIQSAGAACIDMTGANQSCLRIVFVSTSDTSPMTFAIALPRRCDGVALAPPETEITESIQLRQILSAWRKKQSGKAHAYLAGRSLTTTRLRNQLRIADGFREDVLLTAPTGFPTDAIFHRLHESSLRTSSADDLNQDEDPAEFIDGPLMDIELLEAVSSPLIGHLTSDESPTATAIIRGIHDMPLEAQARLAQWKSVFGSRLRIIASADLAAAPSTKSIDAASWLVPELRETLGAFVLELPPLRDRVEDIDVVAMAMLEMLSVDATSTADRISREAMDCLVRYPWPGDVGELESSIRHAMRVCPGDAIRKEHLPLAVRTYRAEPGTADDDAIDLDAVLRTIERRLIDEAVEAADGNRAEAARRLGITRTRLLRRLEDRADFSVGDDREAST